MKILKSPSSRRAWIEIELKKMLVQLTQTSPSSRRAWIEICRQRMMVLRETGALLAEGVDRNNTVHALIAAGDGSPSSRRAWIEMIIS